MRAQLALLMVTLFWGVTFPLIRQAVDTIDPFQFVFVRFSIATLVMGFPLVLYKVSSGALRKVFWVGILLGGIQYVSYVSQTIGLQTIPSGRAAFVTGTNVIMVPLLAPLFRAGMPTRIDFLAAGLATFGLYLVTNPGVEGISVGDIWVLVCALTYAIYIHVLQIILKRGESSHLALTFSQIAGVALFSAIALPLSAKGFILWGGKVWVALTFCSLFATIGTFWLQTRYQGETTPQRAALIFAMEPVFAAFFGYLILGEEMQLMGYAGAAVILLSIVGSEYLKNFRSFLKVA